MKNVGLDEAQAGIKIAGRDIRTFLLPQGETPYQSLPNTHSPTPYTWQQLTYSF